ncbi:MAG TPA: hypothetical protein VGQ09_05855 [Chitinophagaceae bacterium]|jgi:hypothetical protein|nr:hypothetical protein [Chitinophagaceae bacterium]
MINPENYLSQIASIDKSSLPVPLQKGHEFLMKATDDGNDWQKYHDSTAIRNTVKLYFERLSDYLAETRNAKKKEESKQGRRNKKVSSPQANVKQVQKENSEVNTAKRGDAPPLLVERIPEELRFIKRFVNLNGKTKTKDEVLRFINALQKAILEKRIRKTSFYAEQIRFIQQKLIDVYNSMKQTIRIELKPETYETLKEITADEKVMASVGFIKRYIGMNGKAGKKQKAKQLLDQINRAMEKGKINDSDPYIVEIHELKKNLKSFTTNKTEKTLEIEKAELNGLQGILGCACQELNGINEKPAVMNSMDFAKLEFDTIGLTGKWFDLIGDPSSNFTAMVFGKPKMGKSYLCIDFAGYLARNHGKVLYVAREEGLDLTLQNKLNEKNVKHPNLFVASVLPTNLSQYDFIFLDSVNKLGLTPDDLTRLKAANPTKSFIFIFQSTKDGKFRGANSFQHDVDVVIEVPEKGKAVQMGRFNQGGEIEIFNDYSIAA